MTHISTHMPATEARPDLHHRIDNIGWAIFLILTGVIWLFPEAQVPSGTWLFLTGLLLLGLNAVRVIAKVPVSGFMTILGALALLAGLSAFWGVELPLVAIALIVFGFALLTRQLVGR